MEENNQTIKYTPLVGVWEITMNCNMRCKHCGSSCEGPLPDELTTEEALNLCDALADLGLKRITLSGGEPFTRPDWPQIVKRFSQNKVKTNILSNGWLLNRDTIKKAADAGVTNIGMSLDGLEETHDFIRLPGAYQHVMNALEILQEEKVPAGIVSCLHHKNLHQLDELKEILISKRVKDWQLQAAVPMGNMKERPDWILEPPYIDEIIDFAHKNLSDNRINIHLADDVGYFNLKEIEVRKKAIRADGYSGIWEGCYAGKKVIGIRCNGYIIGCLSIRDDKYLEGTVRETPLAEIWNRPGAFSWNRDLKKTDLTGFCRTCQYGSYCLAGCSGTKMTCYNTIYENHFCSYRVAYENKEKEISNVTDFQELYNQGREMAEKEEFQVAMIYIDKALKQQPNNPLLLNLMGYIHYNLENFPECESCNRSVLAIEPENSYAHKGLGICLSRTGRVEEGIELLKKSIQLAPTGFLDPYHDLALVLMENNRCDEAMTILTQGRELSPAFKETSEEFYQILKSKLA